MLGSLGTSRSRSCHTAGLKGQSEALVASEPLENWARRGQRAGHPAQREPWGQADGALKQAESRKKHKPLSPPPSDPLVSTTGRT